MHRFYVDKGRIENDTVPIEGTDFSHCTRVLRLAVGDCVCISDGAGYDYDGVIAERQEGCVVVALAGKRPSPMENASRITLYPCVTKGEKFELVLQKGVELGVNRFVPIISERTVVQANDKGAKKLERHSRIVYEAAKQCGRGAIPEVVEPMRFEGAGELLGGHDVLLVPWEEAERPGILEALHSVSRGADIGIVIGPEGGLSLREIEFLKGLGAVCVTLGNRILRAETAAMAVLACVNMALGEMQR